MFLRLVDRKSRNGIAININAISYIAEKSIGESFYLHIETLKGMYRIYFESEEARQKAFESLLRKKGILNLEGVESTYYRENTTEK